jgi:pimeloyl-ACP methyl ester carboxylesterase
MARLIKIIGCDNVDRIGDVVFVHGLGGSGLETWHSDASAVKQLQQQAQKAGTEFDPGQLDFWPVWLGKDRPDLGIWSLEYEVEPSDWKGGTMPLAERANNVLEIFANKRLGQRPVVFITHSMGGLLVKQLLRNATDFGSGRQRQVAEQTKGLIFLATPHSGSNWSNWAQFINGLLLNLPKISLSVEELEYGHSRLQELNYVYRGHKQLGQIPVKAYYETRPLKSIGVVVDRVSADLGKPEAPTPVDADHISICKISKQDREEGVVYGSILLFLEDYLTGEKSTAPSQSNDAAEEGPSSNVPPSTNALPNLGQPLSRINPFGERGCIREPRRFFGRKPLLTRIFNELQKGSSLSLVGESQVGKSSILAMVRQWGPRALKLSPEQFIHVDMQVVRNEDEFFEALCDELQLPETLRGFRLGRALQGKRYIVCLDEIEKMVNQQNFTGSEREELRGFADGADTPLTLLIASRSPLNVLFDDDPTRTSPLHGLCGAPLRVEGFSQQEALDFLIHRLRGNALQFTPEHMQTLYAQTSGHPARLQAAAADLYRQLAKG